MSDPQMESAFERILKSRKPRPTPDQSERKQKPVKVKPVKPRRSATLCAHGLRKWRAPGKTYCKKCFGKYANQRLRAWRSNSTARAVAGNSEALLYV
jgi:hypothetical protein